MKVTKEKRTKAIRPTRTVTSAADKLAPPASNVNEEGEDILEMSSRGPASTKASAIKPRKKTAPASAKAAKPKNKKITDTRKLTKTAEKPLSEGVTSATSPVRKAEAPEEPTAIGSETAEPKHTLSRVDELLAVPELPKLNRENRARLQMQTPSRLYFYWSVGEDPWTLLRKAFGGETGSYTLVLKLIELRSGSEQIFNAEAEGNWWFNVEPDGQYRAEIGFYAPNRPYFRVLYSNIVETPRRSPSPRRAADADWTINAGKFSQVLNVAGFSQDALDVAIEGDDLQASSRATRSALGQLAGSNAGIGSFMDEDIRYALLALAEGQKLDDLRWKIESGLFDYLQVNEMNLSEEKAQEALREHFEIEEFSFEKEEYGPAVFGSSLVNFPRKARALGKKLTSRPSLSPESSHSYRRA